MYVGEEARTDKSSASRLTVATMSNGPISLPHLNLRRPQEHDSADYQSLPPMQNPESQSNYLHGQSYSREGTSSPVHMYPIFGAFQGSVLHLFLVEMWNNTDTLWKDQMSHTQSHLLQ